MLEIASNLLQNPYDITHLTLGMLLHYLVDLLPVLTALFGARILSK